MINSKVDRSGRFAINVKYQSSNQLNVTYVIETSRNYYSGQHSIANCPATTGCRAVLRQDNGSAWFEIDNDFKLSITNTQDKSVCFDNILVYSMDYFRDDADYLSVCGQSSQVTLPVDTTSFCKSADYSLKPSKYENGTLTCACNTYGSSSLECDATGGQCELKEKLSIELSEFFLNFIYSLKVHANRTSLIVSVRHVRLDSLDFLIANNAIANLLKSAIKTLGNVLHNCWVNYIYELFYLSTSSFSWWNKTEIHKTKKF